MNTSRIHFFLFFAAVLWIGAFSTVIAQSPLVANSETEHTVWPSALFRHDLLYDLGILLFLTLLIFLYQYSMKRLVRSHEAQEFRLLKEKEALAVEKEEQQRFYANLIHEVIKGEAQSILAEAPPDGPLHEHLTEFVKTCELSQSFVDSQNNDLFDLMRGMEFIFSNRLHSEMHEQYFYCNIDPTLKGIRLNYVQKYELIFFLRECLNNIRKYAHYKNVGLNIHREPSGGSNAVVLEIKDDGVGLQLALGIQQPVLEINNDNVKQFQEQFLQNRRCTGIMEIFRKTLRLKGNLVIRSVADQGTAVNLRFFPNSG